MDRGEEQRSDRELVVGEAPEQWVLDSLLSTSGLHPGTRRKLRAGNLAAWVLVSHLLYAHCSLADGVDNPIALVGSAILEDPRHGQGGPYDTLAKLPPCELAELIQQAHDYAVRYPDGYPDWQVGHRAWDQAMAKTPAERLHTLAVRLGIAREDRGGDL